MMNSDSKIVITGSKGVLGSALVRVLKDLGYTNCLTPARSELDCSNEQSVEYYFSIHRPEYVFHLASLVFGLQGNLDNQLRSLCENTKIAEILLKACAQFSIKKVFYAGTVAAYPYPYAKLPLEEDCFLLGEPHKGEYGYAVAKRYALHLLNILKSNFGLDFSYGIFTNIYGPNDRFDTVNGHVIPSLIRKAFEASGADQKLRVWGRADTIRDFIYSDDAAKAAVHCINGDLGIVNISTASGTTMGEVVRLINNNFDDKLDIVWEPDAPIGVSNRVVCNSKLINSGYQNFCTMETGLAKTIDWYRNNKEDVRV